MDYSAKDKVLDIAMNLTRVGGWAAEDYARKHKRIVQFLDETKEYLDDLESESAHGGSPHFQKPFQKFQEEFPRLAKEGKTGPKDPLFWAEEMLTWGSILTHRAKLIN